MQSKVTVEEMNAIAVKLFPEPSEVAAAQSGCTDSIGTPEGDAAQTLPPSAASNPARTVAPDAASSPTAHSPSVAQTPPSSQAHSGLGPRRAKTRARMEGTPSPLPFSLEGAGSPDETPPPPLRVPPSATEAPTPQPPRTRAPTPSPPTRGRSSAHRQAAAGRAMGLRSRLAARALQREEVWRDLMQANRVSMALAKAAAALDPHAEPASPSTPTAGSQATSRGSSTPTQVSPAAAEPGTPTSAPTRPLSQRGGALQVSPQPRQATQAAGAAQPGQATTPSPPHSELSLEELSPRATALARSSPQPHDQSVLPTTAPPAGSSARAGASSPAREGAASSRSPEPSSPAPGEVRHPADSIAKATTAVVSASPLGDESPPGAEPTPTPTPVPRPSAPAQRADLRTPVAEDKERRPFRGGGAAQETSAAHGSAAGSGSPTHMQGVTRSARRGWTASGGATPSPVPRTSDRSPPRRPHKPPGRRDFTSGVPASLVVSLFQGEGEEARAAGRAYHEGLGDSSDSDVEGILAPWQRRGRDSPKVWMEVSQTTSSSSTTTARSGRVGAPPAPQQARQRRGSKRPRQDAASSSSQGPKPKKATSRKRTPFEMLMESVAWSAETIQAVARKATRHSSGKKPPPRSSADDVVSLARKAAMRGGAKRRYTRAAEERVAATLRAAVKGRAAPSARRPSSERSSAQSAPPRRQRPVRSAVLNREAYAARDAFLGTFPSKGGIVPK